MASIHKSHTHNNSKIMVYETKTMDPCHGLTQEGADMYRLMLELKADEILFKAKHPIRYWFQRLSNWWRYGDSRWDGAHYPSEKKYKDGFSYVR